VTTYTAIPDSDIDPDSPITTSLMTLVRDNPIAITEGASGAPKVQTAGITDGAITDAKFPTFTGTANKLVHRHAETYSVAYGGGNVFGTYAYLIALRSGSYKIDAYVTSTGDHRVNFIKNGSTNIYTIDGTAGTITRGATVELTIGDVVEIEIGAINISGTSSITETRLYTVDYFPV